jgi:hypothetical protein
MNTGIFTSKKSASWTIIVNIKNEPANQPQKWTGTPNQPQKWTGILNEAEKWTGILNEPEKWTGILYEQRKWTGIFIEHTAVGRRPTYECLTAHLPSLIRHRPTELVFIDKITVIRRRLKWAFMFV